ncbi:MULTISPECIES: heavy-metal-associated domain-containing protein [Streptomyces]|uniref:Cation transporter n=1 Tax=Streptomyces glycanivorans TaxID=3033808 RepID=A0ABY9JGX7_9ACTN|nr:MULTISPECIES: cation transporter [unclassified Streptomyces]WLQ66370.1 cation transporter [Streptomyces sp. Alt3]WSQ87199.1 cation transporter [Streptomyces sp. NBC_01212]WSR06784.1 cation transporter [Streptomyces sp. NBC_01208]WSR50478.1 cation transporter [Streptomyces sp. NBC_01201]
MTTETDTPRTSGSCCSSTGSCGEGAADARTEGVTAVYEVKGMTCGHCEGAVSEEISGLEGVTSVKAEAATGRVTVASAAALTDEAVRAAVDEAGYELVGRV